MRVIANASEDDTEYLSGVVILGGNPNADARSLISEIVNLQINYLYHFKWMQHDIHTESQPKHRHHYMSPGKGARGE